MSLAQVGGVAGQGITVISSSSTGILLTLQCSAVVNAWQSSSPMVLKYVTATTLFASIQSVCNGIRSPCETEPVLSAFDWSTLAVVTPPGAQITVSITAYENEDCTNTSKTFGTAPNPFVFTDQSCFPGPLVEPNRLYLKAFSCAANVTFIRSVNDPSCGGKTVSFSQDACALDLGDEKEDAPGTSQSFVYTCNRMAPSAVDSCTHPKLCLAISDAAFYSILALLFVHVVQASAWAIFARKKRVFWLVGMLVVSLLPGIGLVVWLRVLYPSAAPGRKETLLGDLANANEEVVPHRV